MSRLDINSLRKHPVGFAAVVAIGAISLTSAAWYKLVIEDLRDKKTDLTTELQATRQRVSSLEATIATYEGQCSSRLQTQSSTLQERCDKQLSAAMEASRVLASSQEKLLDELQRRDRALAVASTQLNDRQAAAAQLTQLKEADKLLSNQMTALHAKHQKLSREYGYNKAKCDKEGSSSGNICEHASMNKSELESIERQIESTKLRLSQVQQQIVQLQTPPK